MTLRCHWFQYIIHPHEAGFVNHHPASIWSRVCQPPSQPPHEAGFVNHHPSFHMKQGLSTTTQPPYEAGFVNHHPSFHMKQGLSTITPASIWSRVCQPPPQLPQNQPVSLSSVLILNMIYVGKYEMHYKY